MLWSWRFFTKRHFVCLPLVCALCACASYRDTNLYAPAEEVEGRLYLLFPPGTPMRETVQMMKTRLGKARPNFHWFIRWSIERKKDAGTYRSRNGELVPMHSWLRMNAGYPTDFDYKARSITVDFLFDEDDGLVWIEVVKDLG